MMRRIAAAFLLLLCALMAAPSAAWAERQWFTDEPIPSRYEISITPNAAASTFTGEVRITVEASAAATAITMNAAGLEVTRATIDGVAARAITNEDAQTLTLTPRAPIQPGRHVIVIAYTGAIQAEAYGLFHSDYTIDGETRRALATQFEPGDARRFAPMWDQPNRRAVFSLTVTAPSRQMVVSNMPVARATRLGGGLTRTRFADTPSMPSYLLFFAMGDLERVAMDVDGVELGVIVRRGEAERARYALQAGAESLRYFTDYFGIRYPLPKLDMIALPGTGGFAAMENWGAILYFDQFLLLDANSSEGDRRFVFDTIAHEIAHQWFGNLVTMNWWDDLWLNEGFASWMASKAVEALHPEWQPWMSQLAGGTQTAMAIDARTGTHPIVQNVDTIDEALLAFDTITYEKGLAVVRMLEAYIGEDDFRRGVRDYLNAHLYGNAQTEDLWRAVQAASGEPVLNMARSFTTQPGFPLLTVTGRADAISVRQRRFAMDDASRTDELWETPVVARRVGGDDVVRTLLPAQSEGQIDLRGRGAYIVNAGQSGYFRVLYDRANFRQLVAAMPTLDAGDQLGLLSDYWAFGRSGDAPFVHYLDLVATLPADADAYVARDTVGSMLALAEFAQGRRSEEAVRAYGRATLAPFFARVGWDAREGENANDVLLRGDLIAALGHLGDEAMIAEIRRRAQNPDTIAGPLRDAVLETHAYAATPEEYAALLRDARAATDFVEQQRAWRRVGNTRDAALARRSLELILGEEIPRPLRIDVLATVSGNHPRLAWDFLVAHRAAVEALLDPLQRLDFSADVAGANADPAVAAELRAYAANFPEGTEDTVAAAIANIELRAETVRERMPAVERWIATHRRAR